MILLNAGPSERGWSRLGAMLQCPQKYAYSYVLPEEEGGGKQLKNKTPIVRGSLIHTGLAHHYRRVQARASGEDENQWFKPLDAIELQAVQDGDEEWLNEVEYCQKALTAYVEHYGKETFQVVAVEQGIYCVIGEHKVTGRADLIIQDRRGKIWIVDHKTTGRINNAQKKYYGISGQLIGYEYMGRQIFGDKWGGMLLNLVQHKSPYKYQRVELPPAPNMLARFPQMVREAERRIVELQDRPVDEYPMAMNELVCYHRYGACEWIEKCKWGKNF